MATLTATPASRISGGSFLIEQPTPGEVFTPEDFTEQHLLIAQTADEFANKEIVPNMDKMEHKEFAVTRELLRKAGELGLSGVDVPEQYGGMQLDKITSVLIADRIAKYASFSTAWGAHTCIGTLPIVYFGTEEQKRKYLPGLASGVTVGAYALSESSSDRTLSTAAPAPRSPPTASTRSAPWPRRCAEKGIPASPTCSLCSPRSRARNSPPLLSSATSLDLRRARRNTRWASAAPRRAH
jgi:hypothetical protein